MAVIDNFSISKMDNSINQSQKELEDKLLTIASGGQVSMAVALGMELNLFQAMATACKASPRHFATAAEIATQAGCKERYIFEWLASMACAGLIDVDPSGRLFSIKPEHVQILAGENGKQAHRHLYTMAFLPGFGIAFPELKAAFSLGGPRGVPYSAYEDTFYTAMINFSRSLHDEHLCGVYIEMLGVLELLQNGANVLDVGCGGGYHVQKLARHFPKSTFTGVDITQSAIDKAIAGAKGLHNAKFICADAGRLHKDWTGKYDLVFFFDSCHDLGRPDLTITEVNRVLKPGGFFAMLEWLNGTGNVYDNIKTYGGPLAALFYGISALHCIGVGSNEEGDLGLGMMMGIDTGKKLLENAGFAKENISVQKPPFLPYNALRFQRPY
ncbi:Cycloartenol-C-24-methyltransferase [Drechslerella dactyloides]|uniref:Cycloartenol-C-24-methyltransferase n=1 Tax=Drechslerella dactyloides TaxID=74499 RepID=A0AAD6J313_DREDA|nr:Cycloartenol-C-24-methyltransferase [Drechslerella dactyloides]